MGDIFAAMTKVNIPTTLKMSEGREMANQQLMNAIPSKETRDFVLMNLVKGSDGRFVAHNFVSNLICRLMEVSPPIRFSWRANVEALHQYFKDHISKFPDSLAGKQYNGPVLFIGGSKSDYIK